VIDHAIACKARATFTFATKSVKGEKGATKKMKAFIKLPAVCKGTNCQNVVPDDEKYSGRCSKCWAETKNVKCLSCEKEYCVFTDNKEFDQYTDGGTFRCQKCFESSKCSLCNKAPPKDEDLAYCSLCPDEAICLKCFGESQFPDEYHCEHCVQKQKVSRKRKNADDDLIQLGKYALDYLNARNAVRDHKTSWDLIYANVGKKRKQDDILRQLQRELMELNKSLTNIDKMAEIVAKMQSMEPIKVPTHEEILASQKEFQRLQQNMNEAMRKLCFQHKKIN
jgi:hypothetical protein